MTNGVIRLGALLSRLPDTIVYASQVSRLRHVSLGYSDRKGCLIPNGVDPQTYVPSQAIKDQVRKELGLPADCVVIGSLARYHPVKDHANFLRAAALLCRRSEGAGVQFVLAGTGVDGSNPVLWALIKELGIGDRIHLLGERGDPERLLAAMDVFTVSSYGEALPMVLLEAMSCGTACVTTAVGDAALAVGNTGSVVAPQNSEALAAAWSDLILAGEEQRRALGVSARQRIITHYSLAACAKSTEELYASLKGKAGK
jgi:glycosyltransferase involved in cell wall biosynthesis